jgi:HSP20 family protein
MLLTKYKSLWDELDNFNKAFTEGFNPALRPWTPAVDIVETENELTFTFDLPGLKMEDIEVHLENGTLTVKGSRKFEHEENKKGYHRVERSYGAFSRAFSLPETVDPDKITASYKDGVLTVAAGKREAAKPRSVKVNVSAS